MQLYIIRQFIDGKITEQELRELLQNKNKEVIN